MKDKRGWVWHQMYSGSKAKQEPKEVVVDKVSRIPFGFGKPQVYAPPERRTR